MLPTSTQTINILYSILSWILIGRCGVQTTLSAPKAFKTFTIPATDLGSGRWNDVHFQLLWNNQSALQTHTLQHALNTAINQSTKPAYKTTRKPADQSLNQLANLPINHIINSIASFTMTWSHIHVAAKYMCKIQRRAHKYSSQQLWIFSLAALPPSRPPAVPPFSTVPSVTNRRGLIVLCR